MASGLFNHPICSVEQRNYTPARARCAAFNIVSVVEVVRLSMTSTRHLTTGVARAQYIIFRILENVAKLAEGRVTKAAIRTSRAYPVVVCTSLKILITIHRCPQRFSQNYGACTQVVKDTHYVLQSMCATCIPTYQPIHRSIWTSCVICRSDNHRDLALLSRLLSS